MKSRQQNRYFRGGNDEVNWSENCAYTKKAKQLLEQRHLQWVLKARFASTSDAYLVFHKCLKLQETIFALDAFGEEMWEICEQQLSKHWVRIEEAASDLPQTDGLAEGLAGIRSYQMIELATRNNKSVAAIPLLEFYEAKSCDVRLFRMLVDDLSSPCQRDPLLREAWAVFDLVSEIGDDISDVAEDIGTYNGNRFIALANANGVRSAYSEYRQALGELKQRISKTRIRSREECVALSGAMSEIATLERVLSFDASADLLTRAISERSYACMKTQRVQREHALRSALRAHRIVEGFELVRT